MDSGKKRLAVAELEPGSKCGCAIEDDSGRLLLRAGTVLSEDFLEGLKRRGVEEVYVRQSVRSASAAAKQEGPTSRKASLIDRSRETYSTERETRFRSTFSRISDSIGEMLDTGEFQEGNIEPLFDVPAELANTLCEDSDQAIVTVQDSAADDILSARCLQLSTLTLAIGVELDYSERELQLLGVSGLLHDLSLFLEPPRMRNPQVTLTADQEERYRCHPLRSADMLRASTSVPEEVCVLISQVHELPDGSGFPRHLKEHRLHRLSKVLSVAETYLALTYPGPGRPPLVPHDAMAYMLFKSHQGLFDSTVTRAFLHQMTLFPIGCRVSLTDGRNATVARRDQENYADPVVRIEESDEWITTHGSEIGIQSPIVSLDRKEMRLDRQLMADVPLSETLGLQFAS